MENVKSLNFTMLCDFYELTMGNGYLAGGMRDRITYFDLFFRSVPDGGGFAIFAGLEQIIIRGENCMLLSAADLLADVNAASKQLREEYLGERIQRLGSLGELLEGIVIEEREES